MNEEVAIVEESKKPSKLKFLITIILALILLLSLIYTATKIFNKKIGETEPLTLSTIYDLRVSPIFNISTTSTKDKNTATIIKQNIYSQINSEPNFSDLSDNKAESSFGNVKTEEVLGLTPEREVVPATTIIKIRELQPQYITIDRTVTNNIYTPATQTSNNNSGVVFQYVPVSTVSSAPVTTDFSYATSTNFFTTILKSVTSYFTDVFTTNFSASNTITDTLVTNNATITNATIGNFYPLLELFTTNFFTSATNTVYSNVNGLSTSSSLINLNNLTFATATNILTSNVNGIVSTTYLSFTSSSSSSSSLYYKESATAPTTAPIASGVGAVAIGDGAKALGGYSSSFGYLNTASGTQSSAFGHGNTSSPTGSSAFGFNNLALGLYSQAFGYSSAAYGDYSSTFGAENSATEIGSSAFGRGNTAAASYSSAFGTYSETYGDYSSAFGVYNIATGVNSSAFGYANTASAVGASAFGNNITNNIANSLQIGPSNTAKLTILSSGFMGIGTTTPTNTLTVYSSTANTSGLRLERLKQSSPAATTTATKMLTVDENGDVILATSVASSGGLYYKESAVAPTTAPTATGARSIALGNGGQASGQNSSSFGYANIASGVGASALGNSNTASGTNSLAIGYMNIANEEEAYVFGRNNEASWYATAVGAYNYALGTDSFAFGNFNTVSAINSSAFGYDNNSSGYYSMSFGYSNDTLGMYSSSFGRSNISSGLYSNAFGLSNTASGTASMSFGYLNVATGDSSIAFGYDNNSSGEVSSAFGAQNFATAYHSSAFGYFNSAAATNSSAYGFTNTASASGASAFGSNVSNSIANSLMIGPSNTAKLTILSSGFMGIGTTTPTNRLTIYAASADTSGLRLERLKSSSAVATTTATKMLTVDTNGDVVLTTLNGTAWGLLGNSGTNTNTNFIGTTDSIDLNFRAGNISNGSLQSVSKNILFGESSGRSLASTTANKYNVGVGYQVFGTTTVSNTGTNNVAIGRLSLFDNTSGSNNVAIGYQSGNTITTGSNNLTLGNNAQVPTSTASNQIRLGDTAITYAGIQVAWTITSDSRLKENINTIPLGLSFLNTLRPVEYHRINDENPNKEFGFIAQEMELALASSSYLGSGLVNTDSLGMKSVRYNDLFSPIVKAIQELDVKVTNNTLSTTTITNLLALASTTNLIGGNVAYATDIDMQNHSIFNVKSISSSGGKWSISEEGKILASEVCIKNENKTVCINADQLELLGGDNVTVTNHDLVAPLIVSTTTPDTATTTSTSTTPEITTVLTCDAGMILNTVTTSCDTDVVTSIIEPTAVDPESSLTDPLVTPPTDPVI